MTSLWRIDGGALAPIERGALDAERQLEDWIERDPSLIAQDLIVIGRQVETTYGGRIDLLGLTSEGAVAIIELKRDRTPREIVAQVLDYASWVTKLTTPDIHRIAAAYFSASKVAKTLTDAFYEAFDRVLPEQLNSSHSMIIVASALDPSSTRIIEYLSQVHGIAINTAFFNVFADGERRYISADWLMDQQQVVDRSETRTRAPWSGVWYANVGDDQSRSWEDMRRYGFLAAGGGRHYSGRLGQLSEGDPIFAYQKKMGYVGYGIVRGSVVRGNEFLVDGRPLFEMQLAQSNIRHDADNPELAEYVVPVTWKKTFPLSEAKTFNGAFANQNIVCRLRDQATLDFLKKTFDAVLP